MFTGIVRQLAPVAEVVSQGPGKRLVVEAGPLAAAAAIGDSIAVNGCCLTVVASEGGRWSFDAGPETLGRTNLGQLAGRQPGEPGTGAARGRCPGRPLGHRPRRRHGHAGQPDTTIAIGRRFGFALEPRWTAQMVPKGSVTSTA